MNTKHRDEKEASDEGSALVRQGDLHLHMRMQLIRGLASLDQGSVRADTLHLYGQIRHQRALSSPVRIPPMRLRALRFPLLSSFSRCASSLQSCPSSDCSLDQAEPR